MIGRVAHFGAQRQRGGFVVRSKLGLNERMPQRNIPAACQIHLSPDAHVFIGRRGIPIHPGEAEIVFPRGKDFHGHGVLPGAQQTLDVVFVGAVRPGHIGAVGDLLTIHPDIGAVVDAEEMKPRLFVDVLARRGELHPEPVRATERAVRGHVAIGKRFFAVQHDAGKRFQVHRVIWIGQCFVCHQCADNRAGYLGGVPTLSRESGSGNRLTGGMVHAGRLHLPTALEIEFREIG